MFQSKMLTEPGSFGSDTMPLGFICSEDGRTLLAVMGNDDGVVELMTAPVAFIQTNGAIVQPMIKPVTQISPDADPDTDAVRQTASMGSESYGTLYAVDAKPADRSKDEQIQSNNDVTKKVSRRKMSNVTPRISSADAAADRAPRRTPGRPRKDANSQNTNPADKMRCEICGQELTRMTLYRKHMEQHAEEKPHRCPKCSASFNVPTNFTLHMATHNTGDPKCPECGRKFARMASLKSHMLLHEKEESLFCTECEDAFSTKAQLDAHVKLHNEKWSTEDARKCRLCHKQFTQPALYRLHIREHYRTKIVKQSKRGTSHKTMYKCKICSKSFQKPSQLMRHIRVHTGEKPFECTVCTRAFTQKGSLQIHMWQHVGVRPYGCQFCNAKFSQKGNLNAHILRVHNAPEGEPIYSCTHCTCVFKKLGSLNGHMNKMHSNPTEDIPQKCDSSTEADMQATVDTVMSQLASLDASVKKPADSTDPELTTTFEGDILQQALKNSGLESKEKNFEISKKKTDAQTSFVTLLDRAPDGSLRRYLTIKQRCIGSIRWYACSFCHKEFKKPSDLIRHLRVHTQEKPFKCSYCYRSFALKSTMIAHERTHTGTKKYVCSTCNKTFGCHSSLIAHTRTHAKPYKCSTCDKSFSTSSVLLSHAKSHTKGKCKLSPEAEVLVPQIVLDEPLIISDAGNKISVAHLQSKQKQIYDSADVARPHKCWVCPAAFRKISHLKQHYRRHTGERPYKCPKCDRRFTSNSVLKSHLHTHEESRPYSCTVCNAKFSTQSSMKRHLVTHSNKRPFMCPYCHKTFKTSVNCRKHMKIHKTELAQQQLEQQKTQQDIQFAPMKDGQPMPVLTENITENITENLAVSEDIRMTFQSEQVAPDFARALNDQLEKISGDKEKSFPANDGLTRAVDNHTLPVVDSNNLGISQTLHADETGTITLPNYTGDQTLTPESIREIEETLNQQLFNIGMHDSNSGSLESRDQPVLNIIYENGKELDTANNGSISATIFPSHFDTFDMSHITLQTDTEIDMGISSANSTSMASILPRSAQEEQHLVPVTTCSNVDDPPNKCSPHLMIVSSMQTGPELSRPVQACSKYSKVIAKADTTDGTDITNGEGESTERYPSTPPSSDLIPDVPDFACNTCDKRFEDRRILEIHEKTHVFRQPVPIMDGIETPTFVFEPESSLQCHMCSQKGFTMETLKNHLSTHRGTKEFQCTECPMKFCTNGGLSRHLKMHASKQQWNCSICMELLPNEAQLKIHTRIHEHMGWNACSIEPDSSQKEPITIDGGSGYLTVTVPDESSVSEIMLLDGVPEPEIITGRSTENVQLTTEKKEYTNRCEYCPKSFRKPSDLIRHVRTHTGERPYQCEFCNKSFAVKCTLDCHMKVHTGKKTFCCHVCNSMFATKGSLKVHMRLHTGSKPFRCPMCDLRFRTSGHRKVHQLTHMRQQRGGGNKLKPKQTKISAIAEVVAEVEKTVETGGNATTNVVSFNEQQSIVELPLIDNISIDTSGISDHQITFNADGTILNNNSMLSINESNQLVANLHFLLANGLVTIQTDDSIPPQTTSTEVRVIEEEARVGNIVTATNDNSEEQPVSQHPTENFVIPGKQLNRSTMEFDNSITLVEMEAPGSAPESKLPVKTGQQNVKQLCGKTLNSKKECDICGKTFMKPCQVERHKRIHTGERPYKCQLCSKSFAQKATLQMHQKHHTGDRPHSCPHCDYSFTQKGNLQTHLKRAHQLDTVQVKKFRRGQQQQQILTAKVTPEYLDEAKILNFDDISFVEFLK